MKRTGCGFPHPVFFFLLQWLNHMPEIGSPITARTRQQQDRRLLLISKLIYFHLTLSFFRSEITLYPYCSISAQERNERFSQYDFPMARKKASAISRRLMLSLVVVIFSDSDSLGLSVRTKNINDLVSNHFLNSLSCGL